VLLGSILDYNIWDLTVKRKIRLIAEKARKDVGRARRALKPASEGNVL
jgi:hypothetical protein